MPTFLIVLAVIALLFFCLYLWVRAKIRRGLAWLKVNGGDWLKVTMLEAAAKDLRQKADKPGADPELPALIERVDAALAKAKAAYAKKDTNGVAEAADGILEELLKRVEAEQKAAQADPGKIVIDVTPTSCDAGTNAEQTTTALALPKPADPAAPTTPPAGQ